MQDHLLHPPGTVPAYWPMLPVLPDFRPEPGRGRGGTERCVVGFNRMGRRGFTSPPHAGCNSCWTPGRGSCIPSSGKSRRILRTTRQRVRSWLPNG
jgi:hypothetical protein